MAPVTRSQSAVARGRWIRSVVEEPVIASCIIKYLDDDDIKEARYVFSNRFNDVCMERIENVMRSKHDEILTISTNFTKMGPVYDNLIPVVAYLELMEPYYKYIYIMGMKFCTTLVFTIRRLANTNSFKETKHSKIILEHANIIEHNIGIAEHQDTLSNIVK